MLPPEHSDQARRLDTLRSYEILDSPREADFDEIVELASRICETPISVINLIDKDRQWFKAEVGLNARETPLATSICAHVILQDDFVEIPDTLQDERMVDNPLCLAEPGLRFYAGARLIAPDGLPIGTLCVLDNSPRHLDDLQRQTLRVLARQVMKQLELRRALKDQGTLLHEADHRVKNSLQTLTSVVRLYGRQLTDGQSLEAFDAIQRRIESVGALHGELQGSGEGKINSRAFLIRVVELLRESGPDTIAISCEADEIDLTANAASALGMIVSEFVANSTKHGFPDRASGEVSISLRRLDDRFELLCSDNGVGSANARSEPSRLEQLGSNLVLAAASQLNGELKNELTPAGSRLSLRF